DNTRKKEEEVLLELLSNEIITKRKKEAEIAKKQIAEAKVHAQKAAEEKALMVQKQAKAKEEAAKKKANQARIAAIVEKEKAIVKEKDRFLIKTEPIYFDYDLWYIRKESREVLGKVIAILNKY